MPFLTGAIPAPKSLAYSLPAFMPRPGIPPAWATIPKKLSVWGNDQYGDCVSAEEAWATAAYSWMLRQPEEVFISDDSVISWARKHGVLNGAMLDDVMDKRAKDGMQADDGKLYTDGPYHTVNWADWATVTSAVYTGPVKIAVDHRPLSKVGAGNSNGWLIQGSGHYGAIDHSIGIGGYGLIGDIYTFFKSAYNVDPPSNAKLTAQGVILFTWGTLGACDLDSLDGMTEEAYIRTPTNPEITPPPAPPPPTPPPGPPAPIPLGNGIYLDPASKTYWLPPDWTRIPNI